MDVKCTPTGPKAKLHSRHKETHKRIVEFCNEAAQVTAFKEKADIAIAAIDDLLRVMTGEQESEVTK